MRPAVLFPSTFAQSKRLEAAILLGLGLILLLRYPLHWLNAPPFLMDFEVYRTASERLFQGEGAQLYTPTSSEMMVFKYAPIWAIALAPLAWLPKHAAAIAWLILSVLCLVGTLALGLRLLQRQGLHATPLIAVAAVLLLTRPLTEEMGNGQANSLWGFLTVGGLYALVHQRGWLAAALLAAASLLKLPALAFLLYMLMRREWGLAARVMAMLVALSLGPSPLIAPHHPTGLLTAWLQALADNGSEYAFMIGNQSVLSMLGRFLRHDGFGLNLLNLTPSVLLWVTAGLGLVTMLLIADPQRPSISPRRRLCDGAMLMVVMTIFSPSAWTATYLTLSFPILVALATLLHQGTHQRIGRIALILGGLIGLMSLLTHSGPWRLMRMTQWHGERYLFLVFMFLPVMGLLLLALLGRQRRLLDGVAQSAA